MFLLKVVEKKKDLDLWFGDVGAGLVSEDGSFFKFKNESGPASGFSPANWVGNGWLRVVEEEEAQGWMAQLRPLLESYTERTPGAVLEEKETMFTWHYRNADPDFGAWKAKELTLHLETIGGSLPINIIFGNEKTVTIRPQSCNPFHIVKTILNALPKEKIDFLLCIDDCNITDYVNSVVNIDKLFVASVGKKIPGMYYLKQSRDLKELILNLLETK